MNKILSPFSFETAGTENDQAIVREIFVENVYRVSRDDVDDTGVVVDLGACFGAFTVYCASMSPDVRVYAYEPEPHNFELLRQNVQLNDIEGQTVMVPQAVGAVSSASSITNEGGGSRLVGYQTHPNPDLETSPTTVVTLEEVWAANGLEHVDVLKLDVEGTEVAIIDAAPTALLNLIRYITLEYDQYSNGFGRLVEKLSETHKVETLGSHRRGAYVYAHRY